MNIFSYTQLTNTQLRSLCERPFNRDESRSASVLSLCHDIADRGDAALRDYSTRFDGVTVEEFRVDELELDAARDGLDPAVRQAIEHAAQNIRTFHAAQIRQEPVVETEPGVRCWREARPIDTVGLYIPAGSAPLPSTVLMLGIPALLAGCRRVILCSPPVSKGSVDPTVLAAAAIIGIREVYRVGGAQAVAAMAFGTESIPKVDKIFGPGGSYVTEAKRIVSTLPGGAAIDVLAGPSELLVIADPTAEASIIAADLLSQAEHDPLSHVVLVTTSEQWAKRVINELSSLVSTLPRQQTAQEALKQSIALVVPSMTEGVNFTNRYAPEHLIINTAEPEDIAAQIRHAGSVFLGPNTPVTAGDYASGTNHTLPTSGTARWANGVSVESFQKFMTFQSITQEGLDRLSDTLITLAEAEGLDAHAGAVRIRQERRRRS